jgi:CUB/sushi domain-containing protein
MASKPEDEHAYILDSFEEFEALARRALHEGEKQEGKCYLSSLEFEYLRFV